MSKLFRHILPAFFFLSLTALIHIASTAESRAAEPPQFALPIKCTLDQDCWIVNYVDMNPAKDIAEDFTCAPRSYDDHKGTDFAIRSRAEMRDGVDVLAALDGTVERLRDGESDTPKSEEKMKDIQAQQKECGNGVFIDHGAGIKTIYCHMKEGSITVAQGDKVKTGDKIGLVGQSGFAEFPHVHFGILWENGVMDPFSGTLNKDGCGKAKASLWRQDLNMKYDALSIFDGGFRSTPPNFKAIEEGESNPHVLAQESDALVFWSAFYGVRAGDTIKLTITAPDGTIFKDQAISQEKDRARQYYYTGRKNRGTPLTAGTYKGSVSITRTGLPEEIREYTVDVR